MSEVMRARTRELGRAKRRLKSGSWTQVCAAWLRVGSVFFFSSRRRHTRFDCDWSSDVCSSDLERDEAPGAALRACVAVGVGAFLAALGGLVQEHRSGLGAVAGYSVDPEQKRSEERRVGKECRSRWSPYH